MDTWTEKREHESNKSGEKEAARECKHELEEMVHKLGRQGWLDQLDAVDWQYVREYILITLLRQAEIRMCAKIHQRFAAFRAHLLFGGSEEG